MIARYLGGYQQLAHAGFVGDEQRINWLDSLRVANEEARIFGVEYDIGAQKTVRLRRGVQSRPAPAAGIGDALRFRLLHEEDLPRFFEALGRYGGGYFTVEQCHVRRMRTGDSTNASIQPNLAAECDVRWLTMKPPARRRKKDEARALSLSRSRATLRARGRSQSEVGIRGARSAGSSSRPPNVRSSTSRACKKPTPSGRRASPGTAADAADGDVRRHRPTKRRQGDAVDQ